MGNLLSNNNPVYKCLRSSLVGSLLPSQDLQAFFEICKIEEQTQPSIASLKLNAQSCFYLVLVGEVTVYGNNAQVQSVNLTTYSPGDTLFLLPGLNYDNGAVMFDSQVKLTYQHRSTEEPGKLLVADRAAVEKFLASRPHLQDLASLCSEEHVQSMVNMPAFRGASFAQVQCLISSMRLCFHNSLKALKYNIEPDRLTKYVKKIPTDGLNSPAMQENVIGLVFRGKCVAGSDPLALAKTANAAHALNTSKSDAIAPSSTGLEADPPSPGLKGPGFFFGYERTLLKIKPNNQSLHSIIALERCIVAEITLDAMNYLGGIDKPLKNILIQNFQSNMWNYVTSKLPLLSQIQQTHPSIHEKLGKEMQLYGYEKGDVIICGENIYVMVAGSMQIEGEGDGEEHSVMKERVFNGNKMLFDFNGYFGSLVRGGLGASSSKAPTSSMPKSFQCLTQTLFLVLPKRIVEDIVFSENRDLLHEMYLYLLAYESHGTLSNMRLDDILHHSVARTHYLAYLKQKNLKPEEVTNVELLLRLYEQIIVYEEKVYTLLSYLLKEVPKEMKKKLKKSINTMYAQSNKMGSFMSSPGMSGKNYMGLTRSEKSSKNVGGHSMVSASSRAKSFFNSQMMLGDNDDDSDTDIESDEEKGEVKFDYSPFEDVIDQQIVQINGLIINIIAALQTDETANTSCISKDQVTKLVEMQSNQLQNYSKGTLYKYLNPMILTFIYPPNSPKNSSRRSLVDILYYSSVFKYVRKDVLNFLYGVYKGGVFESYAVLQEQHQAFSIYYDPSNESNLADYSGKASDQRGDNSFAKRAQEAESSGYEKEVERRKEGGGWWFGGNKKQQVYAEQK